MKLFITLIITLISFNIYACECALRSTMEKTESSDFVGRVKINQIERDSINPEYLNLTVEVLDIFKGNFNNDLKILTDKSMCNIYTPKGTEWLVYASFDKNDNLSFGYCSGSIQIDRDLNSDKYPNAEKNYKKSIKRKLELLKFLNQKNIISKSNSSISSILSSDCLNSIKGYEAKVAEFAVYEVSINKDLTVEKIKQIKKFSNSQLNSQVDNCIKNINFRKRNERENLKEKTKKIIPIFYYEKEQDNPSFISGWDL
ncbi:hypothetical protein [uncultured Christiangramia sp.]|uniref:hypothetical protein n=1 Tax=Christiangramia sp. 3-2217-3z TaxID=3417564 RepID=UPI0026163A53|nr:hypothetical protein [uncultured Christiangramia sp.]